MALFVPNTGERRLLELMLQRPANGTDNYYCRLYNNNYTPSDSSSVYGVFVEASFTGYGAFTFARNTWYSAITNGSNEAEVSYGPNPFSWTCTASGQTVYGYWVEDGTDRTVLWAERFGTPRVVAPGDILNLTPKFTLRSQ